MEAGRGRGEGAPEELGGKQESTCVRPSPDRVTAVGEQRQEWGGTQYTHTCTQECTRAQGTRRQVHKNTLVVHGHMLTRRHMNTITHTCARHTGTRSHAGTRTRVHKNAHGCKVHSHVYTRMHTCTMHTGTRRHTQTCTREHTRGTWAHAHTQAHEHKNAYMCKAHWHTLTHWHTHVYMRTHMCTRHTGTRSQQAHAHVYIRMHPCTRRAGIHAHRHTDRYTHKAHLGRHIDARGNSTHVTRTCTHPTHTHHMHSCAEGGREGNWGPRTEPVRWRQKARRQKAGGRAPATGIAQAAGWVLGSEVRG